MAKTISTKISAATSAEKKGRRTGKSRRFVVTKNLSQFVKSIVIDKRSVTGPTKRALEDLALKFVRELSETAAGVLGSGEVRLTKRHATSAIKSMLPEAVATHVVSVLALRQKANNQATHTRGRLPWQFANKPAAATTAVTV